MAEGSSACGTAMATVRKESSSSSSSELSVEDCDKLVDKLLGLTGSPGSDISMAHGWKEKVICTLRRDEKILLQPVPSDAEYRSSLPPSRKSGFDYYTLSTARYVFFRELVSFESLRSLAEPIKGCIEKFLSSIERSTRKNLFRLAIETKFGKEFWRFPDIAKGWGTLTSSSLKLLSDGNAFLPQVEELDAKSLIEGRTCIEESLTTTVKFSVHGGPEKGVYSALLREELRGQFVIELICKDASVACRNRFDFAIPGKSYDIRIVDTVGLIVMEGEGGTICQIASEIVSSMKRSKDDRLAISLVWKGRKLGYNWKVKFIRQKEQKLYYWNNTGWTLSVFKAYHYVFPDFCPKRMQTYLSSFMTVSDFVESRFEVELYGPKYYPEEVKTVYPTRDAPWNVYHWTTEEVLRDFTQFVNESFNIAEILDKSRSSRE